MYIYYVYDIYIMMYIYIHIHIHTYTYTYIYMYIGMEFFVRGHRGPPNPPVAPPNPPVAPSKIGGPNTSAPNEGEYSLLNEPSQPFRRSIHLSAADCASGVVGKIDVNKHACAIIYHQQDPDNMNEL